MTNTLRFAGYAAVFNTLDRGGDVIRPGAFGGSLKRTRGRVPLLFQHGGEPIGEVHMLAEDDRGLRLIAALPAGSDAAVALTSGRLNGLSFGYRVRSAEHGAPGEYGARGRAGSAPRTIHDLDLIEVSLVTHPMQPAARVIAVIENLSHILTLKRKLGHSY